MKKYILILLLLLIAPVYLSGQTEQDLMSNCKAAANTSFLKNYVIKLAKGSPSSDLRWKEPFYLSKNITYNFTLCNADNSSGQLIMKILDSKGIPQAMSYTKSGQTIPAFNFECKSSGQYQFQFDFKDFQPGIGVGIVSMVKSK
jgi:hypothetical protein